MTQQMHKCSGCGTHHPAAFHDHEDQGDELGRMPVDRMTDLELLGELQDIAQLRREMVDQEHEVVTVLRSRRMPWSVIAGSLGEVDATVRRRYS